MATTQTPAVRPRAKVVVETPTEDPVTQDDPNELVTANVPRKLKLTLDGGTTVDYREGTQKIPRAHATHWYAVNHGVKIVD